MTGPTKLRVVTILAPEEVEVLGGLPKEAVCGFMPDPERESDRLDPEAMRPNPAFVEFMHGVIRSCASDRSIDLTALEQRNDGLYVIDMRTPHGPQGSVPAEDIIGQFKVHDGEIVPDSYRANPGYQVLTKNGLVRLPEPIRSAFLRSLRECAQDDASGPGRS